MKKLGQKGFTLIEVLIVVVALSAVIGIGYYVYSASEDKKDTSSASQNVQTETKPEEQAKKYLEIKELGIKFELTDKLNNAYYHMIGGNAYLSVHEIDSMKGFESCKADSGESQSGIGAINYAKVGEDHFGSPWTEEDLKNFTQKKIGDTHYWITPRSQAPCYDLDTVSENDPNIEILGSFKNALVNQGTTITKL